MFTGIVELMGTVAEYNLQDNSASGGQGVSVTIKGASAILNDCHIGDSIACNGICLTVTAFDKDTFKVGISPETIVRTDVADWVAGTRINLERAVSQDVRFGGHYVQGHVDTVASIVSVTPEGNSLVFGFKLRDSQYEKFIVEKGFICIDGTSLTVTQVDADGTFYIAMIAHTQDVVVMPLKKIGSLVNIEVDLTGKLIEKQISVALQNQFNDSHSTLNNLIEKIIDEKVQKYLSKK
ncbi:similar to Saccharomyces cerevisiae YBR256C RIB5 Riboflavin synthase [Maudiozyma barnettii]|uniref:Riboflavin synthase n=1 Tax=Maudiozyma barnettii TaxID=61262 RepID=A0A8H2VF78_9SACH|nr:riboflavin synthase [Kazachstania barnettii]CAB4254053.1 similar to Saccharomyces cerevisiae YBR256C RIB5 Riboflavin synthase [Kazachstania barnettii]CAD1781803.1 similar to Saccharomyces cerevisiae YBR256C RIB5 Riboflavin synthase [Kazachstania barnettii]